MTEQVTAEQWRAIAGHEGFYEVSDQGRVRSLDREFIRADGQRQRRRGRVLKQMTGGTGGYPSVTLRHGMRRTVHVLVCTTFHGPKPFPGAQAAHFNGNKQDNRATNLRWATQVENVADSVRLGVGPQAPWTPGEENGNARLTWDQVVEIRRLWDTRAASQSSLSRRFGISRAQVQNIVHRRGWSERPAS